MLKREIGREIEGKWRGREAREAKGWEWGSKCAAARRSYEEGER
jgi:hypothetical protein